MGQRWQSLHNMVYIIGILGVWHYWWQVKKDVTEPLIYAAILAALLSVRIIRRQRRKRRPGRSSRPAPPLS
jgi:sulfoxide reductase heme-binding subunit YedZ